MDKQYRIYDIYACCRVKEQIQIKGQFHTYIVPGIYK